MPSTHKKDKPWDHEGINHWEVVTINKEDNPTGMLEESSFATLFPKYRETYLRDVWPQVTRALKEHGIACELNLVEGSMTVRTTRKAYDPYIIIKARDLMKLLSRGVPLPQAVKILEDEMACDIIKIGGLVRNKERFVKRRQRLLGPNGNTLKAIELVTDCYVLVQGNTVSAMGSFKGLKSVRKVVEDCMANIHPVYHVKSLMIRKELSEVPELKNENWDRFLPKFKKRNVQTKKPKNNNIKKKEYTPFPPPQLPSKVDLQIESGEYFLSKKAKRAKQEAEKAEKQTEKLEERNRKRASAFVAPEEDLRPATTKKQKQEATGLDSDARRRKETEGLVESLKKKALGKGDASSRRKEEGGDVGNYVMGDKVKKKGEKEEKKEKKKKKKKKRED